MGETKKYDLNERLVDYAVEIINVVKGLPNDRIGNHLGHQLLRSGTSPSLNYGEAQSAESKKDFIHKLKIILKELRESYNCLKILEKAKYLESDSKAKNETDELIAIFNKSILTTRKGMNNRDSG